MSLARQTELLQNLLQEIQGVIDPLDVTFHNAATAAADGTKVDIGIYKTLIVEISGSPTSFTLDFKAIGPGAAELPLKGLNKADWSSGITTSTSGQKWVFDVEGETQVFMDLREITPGAGSITVKGRMVA